MDRNVADVQAIEAGGRVRLVRACGSKPLHGHGLAERDGGQARKSLWIETVCSAALAGVLLGQARKSLWIETMNM